ncbi:MAG TPA: hypothetical protein VNS34_22450 [Rhizobiaceae bacterium]|nr:hypothetical protein [Rhizobiaceae bacterium]
MTARILSFPGVHRENPASKLQIIEDDFAAKVTAETDRRFWIRVEKDPGETIVVSDFVLGSLAEQGLVAGLRLALRTLEMQDRKEILFKDLLPDGTGRPLFGLRLEQMAEQVKRAAGVVAADMGREVTAFSIRTRGDKMDALARFSG